MNSADVNIGMEGTLKPQLKESLAFYEGEDIVKVCDDDKSIQDGTNNSSEKKGKTKFKEIARRRLNNILDGVRSRLLGMCMGDEKSETFSETKDSIETHLSTTENVYRYILTETNNCSEGVTKKESSEMSMVEEPCLISVKLYTKSNVEEEQNSTNSKPLFEDLMALPPKNISLTLFSPNELDEMFKLPEKSSDENMTLFSSHELSEIFNSQYSPIWYETEEMDKAFDAPKVTSLKTMSFVALKKMGRLSIPQLSKSTGDNRKQ